MSEQIDALKQLQALDGEIYALRKQQEQKPLELQTIEAETALQEARTKEVEARLRTFQVGQKEKEVELQTHEANIKKLQSQLFQLKTNKEYSAMQREIESIKADNSVLEETILKLFDTIEAASKERQQEQAKLAEQQKRLQVERTRIDRELAEIATRVAELEKQREAIAPSVHADTLDFYDRILEMRDGLALVPLMANACGGCNRRLPPQVINEVFLKAKIVTCESCNRILYFDEAHSKL